MERLTSNQLISELAVRDSWSALPTYYADGGLAIRTTVADVRLLARRGAVDGWCKKGLFSCVRLKVSVRAAHRILNQAKPADDSAKVTKPKSSALGWPAHYERAKLGRLGGSDRLTHTPQGAVMEPVPGLAQIVDGKQVPLVMRRRVVAS